MSLVAPLDELARQIPGSRWNDPLHDAFMFTCRCGKKALARMDGDKLSVECSGGCRRDDIISAAALRPFASQAIDSHDENDDFDQTAVEPASASHHNHNGGHPGSGLADQVRGAIRSNPQLAYECVLGASLTRKPGSREPVALCPLHDDSRPSLRVNLDKGTWYCDPCAKGGDLFNLAREVWGLDFPACAQRLAELLNVSQRSKNANSYSNGNRASQSPKSATSRKIVRRLEYEIRDLDGTLKATHGRVEYDDGTKDMPWEPKGIKPAELPLFQVEKTTDSMGGETVVVCEGEKAAAALWERRQLAVGTVTGADKAGLKIHCDESLKALVRFDIVLWPDNDEGGRRHMLAHSDALIRLGCKSVRWIEWREAPPKGDAANFTGDDAALQALIDAAGAPPMLPAVRDTERLTIIEKASDAVRANDLYLQRPAIVDKLLYSQSTSLLVGPKHGGKTTNVRTIGLSVSRGLPWGGRQTTRGHVLYVTSSDELASTRMALLDMDWNENEDWLELLYIDPEKANANPALVLDEIAIAAKSYGSILIVIDMLFDFIKSTDEMSYAGTRAAILPIQRLADQTKAHVIATHHSPKYMLDAASAATAALGSQGIAARFSPIILCRNWGGIETALYSIESTTIRDPRGLAIVPTCVTIDPNRWARLGEPFKPFMKWVLYEDRVMAIFEGGEAGKEHTAASVARDLGIDRSMAQNALYQLAEVKHRLNRRRSGQGGGYKYWIGSDRLFEGNQSDR